MSFRSKSRRHGGEDVISLLPDPLLCQILSNLPTKDAVKTSVLSQRWKSVWLSVPGLELNDQEFPNHDAFVSFIERFIGFSVESPIDKLKLTSKRDQFNPLAVKSWVGSAVKRKLQHLEIGYSERYLGVEFLSADIFICQTLLCLKLRFVALSDFNRVSLPLLRAMNLEAVSFVSETALETLIASCPVLEELSIVTSHEDMKILRVCSQSISRLSLVLSDRWEALVTGQAVIDAPRLKYLSLEDKQSARLRNVFNVKDILEQNDWAKRSSICKFLASISSVRDMTICWNTLKVIRQYCYIEPLPQFCYMSKLHAKFFAADLQILPDLLESCPNLKSLVLELNDSIKKEDQISFSSLVPLCVKSCLEHVEMRKPIAGFGVEMKLIRYFLENSTLLKKLTLRMGCPRMKQESLIFMELLKFRRCSSACEVEVVGLEETLMKL